MKRYFGLLLLFSTQLFGGISSKDDAQEFENILAARRPMETPHGIVVSDNFGSSLALITSTGTVQLAAAPGIGNFVSCSPDKSALGVKIIEADGKQTPALIDIASAQITRLITPQERCGEVSFSNDGKLAYTIGENLIVRTGVNSTSYALDVYANLAPISPDGSRAAFNTIDDQITILDLTTTRKTQITSLPRGYFNPQWSPDASKLLYSSLAGDLFVYELTSQQTYALENGSSPCWSPDGTTILYSKSTSERERLINSDIWSSRFDGTDRKQLTSTADQFEIDPSYGSDGNSILCAHVGKNQVKRIQITKQSDIHQAPSPVYEPVLQPQRVSVEAVRAPVLDTINLPYVNQIYDTPDWHSGGSSCAPTAASIILAYYKIIPPWNIWVSWPSPGHYSPYGSYVADKYLNREYYYADQAMDASDVKPAWGGFGYMWSTGSPHTRMAGYYANHNVSAGQSEAPPYTEATTEIYAGRPYTLCVMLTTAGHLIIARGIYSDHTLVFNDPYGNKNNLPAAYKSPYGKGVTYDWPGYNNGFQNLTGVAWCIRTQYTAPAISDTLVDDLQFYNGFSINFTAPASYAMWKDRNGSGWNDHFWYVKTKGSNTTDTCFAAWQPNLYKDGSYEVFAYIPLSNSTKARYKITHRDSTQTVVANQKAYSKAWMSLGTYNFTKGTAGSVRLGDQSDTAGQEIVFDAMRWSYRGPMTVSILRQSEQTPTAFELLPAYPNPFNPSTHIRFSLPVGGFSTMKIYDALGREQEALLSQTLAAGTYSVAWNAADRASGVYFCRLSVVPAENGSRRTESHVQTIKLILQK